MQGHAEGKPIKRTHAKMRLCFIESPFTTKSEYQAWLDVEDAGYQAHLLKKARSRAFGLQQSLTASIANMPVGKPLRVERRIYWGNEYTVRDLRPWKESHNISHVCNTAHHSAAVGLSDAEKLSGVEYLELPMLDDTRICNSDATRQQTIALLRQAIEWVDDHYEQGGTVLVNCQAGRNRSGATLLGWLLKRRRSATRPAHDECQRFISYLRELNPDCLQNDALIECAMVAVGLEPFDAVPTLQLQQAAAEQELVSRSGSADEVEESCDPFEWMDAGSHLPSVASVLVV